MLKKLLVSGVVAGAFVVPAIAADAPIYKALPAPPVWNWTGSYIGLHAGYTWGDNTATFTGFPEAGFATVLPVGRRTFNSGGFIGGAQIGWNYQFGSTVLGAESDISWTGRKANAAFPFVPAAFPAFVFTQSVSQKLDWLGTSRLRLGFTPMPNLLLYGTGGIAYGDTSASSTMTPAAGFVPLSYSGARSDFRVGWAFGAGAEWTFAPRWSAKIEYLYYDLGTMTVVGFPTSPGFAGNQTQTHFDLTGHIVRIGLNYRPDWGPWLGSAPAMYTKGPVMRVWDIESGARFWVSTGKTKKDLFDVPGTALVSRLTYTGLDGYAVESYARADHRMGFFVKGYLGTGKLNKGNLQDEDFPPFVAPYSSTNSSQKNGSINYGSIDAGYNFWRGPTGKVGAFVGYHYYEENLNAYGCLQNGLNPGICGAPGISNNILVISQDNKWHSLRLGLNGEIALMNNLVLSGDAAWVPYGWMDGKDTHWLRLNVPGGFNGPTPEDGRTSGVQLEAMAKWYITQNFTIGVGGRYWYMEVPNGKSHFEVSALPVGAFAAQVEKWKTERYGAFIQAGVKW